MADALGTPGPPGGPGVVSAVDHRLDQAGLIAPQSSTLAVRTGVMWGPGSTTVVTGTSATGTMTYAINMHHWVTTRGTADGVYLGTKEASTTVPTTAAPGSNSRIDIIWSKQQDQYSTLSADATSAELYGVTQGTAAASPTAPGIPIGAVEIARATVAAGATSTNGANVTITNTAPQVVARGARIPVRNQAERDALTTYAGLEVFRLDTGKIEGRNAGNTGWQTVAFATDTGWTNFTVSAPLTNGATGNQYRVLNGMCTVSIDASYNGSWGAGFTIATLAAEARPTRKLFFNTTWYGDASAYISIDTNGAVAVANATGVHTGMVGTCVYPVG